ncbi:Uncharacterized protein GY17_00002904 [Cryptosporidium hominis]|uniref:Uncharacterized protein n=2 Tax=Cryptosporidium hominis TaxID=237895 RepID=A0ABX5BCE2_CRYHO|nr:Uncharacterized protein GY17_00002904 [Cryptosporidium hominis]|eukprot:PPS94124.1 Uncharacterized protein GY17_00002904 [Cryptosporidium hominis]
MRKSLASLVGNIGNSIGLGGTPSVRIRDLNEENNEINDFEISSKRGTYGLASPSKKMHISPSRPIGLPPPLPYNTINNRESGNSRNTDNNYATVISSSVENTRILTPFNIRNGINSIKSYKEVDDDGYGGGSIFGESVVRGINDNLGNNIDGRTPQTTKSQVRIKSLGMTPSRFESSIGNLSNNNNKLNVSTSSIFTPLSTKTRFLPILPTSPRKEIYENLKSNLSTTQNENMLHSTKLNNEIKLDSSFSESLISSTMVSTSNFESNNYLSESSEILRKRLNEKNQEIHFLKKTVKDLETRIISLENKEKMFIENEVNNKKKIDELLIEKHENMDRINNLKKEIIKLQEDNNNILKENKCINGNYELKCYEITKLNDEINNFQNSYKHNFTLKYLTPLKNILYDSILEIERKIGNETIMNVEFDNSNMEMDAIIKTLHEYIQNFKNFIILKIDQDYNIIESLHSEISDVNKDLLELKNEYINLKKSYNNIIKKRESYSIINNDENNSNNEDQMIKDKVTIEDSISINEDDKEQILEKDKYKDNNKVKVNTNSKYNDSDNNNNVNDVNNNDDNSDNDDDKKNHLESVDSVFESQNDHFNQETYLDNTPKDGGNGFTGSNKLQFGLTSLAKSLLGYTYLGRNSLLDNNNNDNQEKEEISHKINKDSGLKTKKTISKKKDDNKTKTNQSDKSKKKVLKKIDKNKNQENLKNTSTKKNQSTEKKKSSLKSKKSLSSSEIDQVIEDNNNKVANKSTTVKGNKSTKADTKTKTKTTGTKSKTKISEIETKSQSNTKTKKKSSTSSNNTLKNVKSEDDHDTLNKNLKKSSKGRRERTESEDNTEQSKTRSTIKKRMKL